MSESSESMRTTDHDEIREWADEHGGQPARVAGTGGDDDAGMIRMEFPDAEQSDDEDLEGISWDEWFEAFEGNDLALVYQEDSNFSKLVSRDE